MPTYEYVCKACGHELELFQSMKDSPKRKCPECGKNALERKIGTGAAVLFKGSGFYQTDYRSESYKKAADSDKKPEGAKETGKAEAKSESKAESSPTKTETPKTEAKPEKKPKKAGKGGHR
jgi:putative FmdB family regulatory protein